MHIFALELINKLRIVVDSQYKSLRVLEEKLLFYEWLLNSLKYE